MRSPAKRRGADCKVRTVRRTQTNARGKGRKKEEARAQHLPVRAKSNTRALGNQGGLVDRVCGVFQGNTTRVQEKSLAGVILARRFSFLTF